MKMRVNEKGLEYIRQTLIENHKNFQGCEPEHKALLLWAAEVEDHIENGHDAFFEIRGMFHVSGRAECFHLNREMLS